VNPKAHEAHYYLAKVYSTRHQFNEALAEIRAADRLDPDNLEYLHYLGWQYCATGQPDEAEAAFQAALKKTESPLVVGEREMKAQLTLYVRQLQELRQLASKGQRRNSIGSKPFDGSWQQYLVGVGRLESPGHSEEEKDAIKKQFAQSKGQELDVLMIRQDSSLLRAYGLKSEWTGCAYDRWFAIGRREDLDYEGCHVERAHITCGELGDDGVLRGSALMISTADKPKKCPRAIGTTELVFEARKQ
jgi:tetratricopeptide (TPR) repeat protein